MTWEQEESPAQRRRREYDSPEHRQGRAAAMAVAVPTDRCARCRLPLGPDLLARPESIHWDHNDERDGYLGLSHGVCDSRAGGEAAARAAKAGGWFPVRQW